jgi:hypothetical protein
MTMQPNRMHWRFALLSFGAVQGIAAMTSCSSGEPVPGGGRVEHAGSRTPGPVLSADPGQIVSHPAGVEPLSPLDRAISEMCPPRPLSQNVPERACTKDSECGDGFCDREHCAAIWTCDQRYGQRCYGPEHEKTGWCIGLCIEGRCRSCLSNEECIAEFGGGAECNPNPTWSGGRRCGIRFDKPPNITPGRLPPDAGFDP